MNKKTLQTLGVGALLCAGTLAVQNKVVVDPRTPEVFKFSAKIVEANKYGR